MEVQGQEKREELRRKSFIHIAKGNERGKEGTVEPWLRWDTIWSASKIGDEQLVKRLLESDPELVRKKNTNDETALHFACKHGHFGCVKLLLEMGAQSSVSLKGKTPVELACENRHGEIVKLLCKHNHVGTDEQSCRRMLSVATKNSDFVSLAVLQTHLEPALAVEDAEERRSSILQKRRQTTEESIIAEASALRLAAVIHPTQPPPPLGETQSWSAKDVERWAAQTLEENGFDTTRLFLSAFARYNITGSVLLCLSRVEVKSLLQRIGITTPFRTVLVDEIGKLGGDVNDFEFTQSRVLPVAVGNATAFRVIGTVKAAMSTPLQTARRFVQVNAQLTTPVPNPFQFVSMRDGLPVPKEKENTTIVSHLGFILLVKPLQP